MLQKNVTMKKVPSKLVLCVRKRQIGSWMYYRRNKHQVLLSELILKGCSDLNIWQKNLLTIKRTMCPPWGNSCLPQAIKVMWLFRILHFSCIAPSVFRWCDTVNFLECSYKVGVVIETASIGYLPETHLRISVKNTLDFLDFHMLDIDRRSAVCDSIDFAVELPATHAQECCKL